MTRSVYKAKQCSAIRRRNATVFGACAGTADGRLRLFPPYGSEAGVA